MTHIHLTAPSHDYTRMDQRTVCIIMDYFDVFMSEYINSSIKKYFSSQGKLMPNLVDIVNLSTAHITHYT